MERFPEGVEISLNDFRNCGWLAVVNSTNEKEYSSIWKALSSAARQAIEDKKLAEGKILWLLADACSMALSPSSLNEPFKPFMMMADGNRSALPEDYQSDEIIFFSGIVEEITNTHLCGRISDLVWLLLKPRDPKYALMAIDQYIQLPISTDHWVGDSRKCWERAIKLCLMLRAGAGTRLQDIEVKLLEAIKNSTNKDGNLALWVTDLISENSLGKNDQVTVAEKIEQLAIEFDSSGDLHRARYYFDSAAEIFRKLGDEEKYTEMTIKVAEGYVKEALARQSSESPSNIVAASFYENAIQKYRNIPRVQRVIYDINNRIANLRTELSAAGKRSVDEMSVLSSPSVDISELVENARNAVRGKSALDALAALANIYEGARVKKVRRYSEKMVGEYPLQSLFGATHMSHDGRVIAKRPGADLGSDGDNETIVWAEMVKHYIMELGIVVQGDIWPALEIMHLEHRYQESDFYYVTRQSPILPPGRERLMAKALFAGYDKDFITALHILVPQLEHLVRFHLKQRGVKTTNLDINGIENENGLSALVELPEVEEIFGEDLAFEIKALFCSSFGPNIRNELAHGLLGYDESQSIYSIYAWWVGLRIVFNTFWNSRKAEPGNLETDDVHGTGDA